MTDGRRPRAGRTGRRGGNVLFALAAGLGLAGACGRAGSAAPDSEVTAFATATVATIFSIKVDPAAVNLGMIQADGRANDFPAATTVTVRSNAGGLFVLKARIGAEVPGASLSVRVRRTGQDAGRGAWVSPGPGGLAVLSSTPAEARGNLPDGTAVTFDYRVVATPATTPGPKTWTVTLTLAGAP